MQTLKHLIEVVKQLNDDKKISSYLKTNENFVTWKRVKIGEVEIPLLQLLSLENFCFRIFYGKENKEITVKNASDMQALKAYPYCTINEILNEKTQKTEIVITFAGNREGAITVKYTERDNAAIIARESVSIEGTFLGCIVAKKLSTSKRHKNAKAKGVQIVTFEGREFILQAVKSFKKDKNYSYFNLFAGKFSNKDFLELIKTDCVDVPKQYVNVCDETLTISEAIKIFNFLPFKIVGTELKSVKITDKTDFKNLIFIAAKEL